MLWRIEVELQEIILRAGVGESLTFAPQKRWENLGRVGTSGAKLRTLFSPNFDMLTSCQHCFVLIDVGLNIDFYFKSIPDQCHPNLLWFWLCHSLLSGSFYFICPILKTFLIRQMSQ